MHTYICMCKYIHVYIYVYVNINIYANIIHTYMYTYMYGFVFISICEYVAVYTNKCLICCLRLKLACVLCVGVRVCVGLMYIYIRIHVYKCT